MKILFLPNFKVYKLKDDDQTLLDANKYVNKKDYWFFKYMQNVNVEVIDNSRIFPFSLFEKTLKFEIFQAIKAFLCQNEYDVIISHSYNSGFVLSLLRSVFHVRSPPHFVIDIGCLNGGKENKFQIKLIRFALRSVKGLVYHSTVNEKFYSKYFPSLDRIFIHFGVDPEYFSPLCDPPRNDYALSIGYAKRDYQTLLKAWRFIDFPLKIVGVDKSTIADENFSNIEFIPKVPINLLREYIHHAKFIVLPIENENYSVGQMTFLQSMAMEKLIIIDNVPGVADYISNNNCLTYEYESIENITEKIKLLFSDQEFSKAISFNARKSIIRKYNERDMASLIYNYIAIQ